ncbi:hypothetical protein PMAA_097740 [Talaromyces marneffei ATCC 18224]|uniref:Uncharacterized protein n=2 Tax=Talaromyces marneffei TaxID=37727 RepID=B6QIJ0_TALMQ|nr:hypothetical protein PMAA_097740 [Talaromyces marneffei ATCC 18224]
MIPHKVAYIPSKKVRLEIGKAEYTHPGGIKIVVKTAAVAVNPFDWVNQDIGRDLAWEAVAIGPGVTRFKVGGRVVGHAVGMDERDNKSSEEPGVQERPFSSRLPNTISSQPPRHIIMATSKNSALLQRYDYKRPTVIADTTAVLKGSVTVVAVAVGQKYLGFCIDVLSGGNLSRRPALTRPLSLWTWEYP